MTGVQEMQYPYQADPNTDIQRCDQVTYIMTLWLEDTMCLKFTLGRAGLSKRMRRPY